MQNVDQLVNQLRPLTGPEGGLAPPVESNARWFAIAVGMFLIAVLVFRRIWRRPRSPANELRRSLNRAHPNALAGIDRAIRHYLSRRHDPQCLTLTNEELVARVPEPWLVLLKDLENRRFRPDNFNQSSLTVLIARIEPLIRADSEDAAGPVGQ